MAPLPQFYDSTDTTLQSGAIAVTAGAGNVIAPVEYHLWNAKGGSASLLRNARLVAKVFDGTNKVSSGYPILDEAWIQIAITGLANPGNVAMASQSTGFIPIGAGRPISLADIPANCARYIQVQYNIPANAPNLTQEVYLELIYDQTSIPLSAMTSLATGPGVISDRINSSLQRLISGFILSANGTATINVGDSTNTYNSIINRYVYGGLPYTVPYQALTFNQTDGNNAALTAGNSYVAVISQAAGSSTVTVTKGAQGATPAVPATPANQIYIGQVTVTYQAGGTSAISAGNVSQANTVWGEFWQQQQAGLNLSIGAGSALSIIDTEPLLTSQSLLSLPDNSYVNVWLQPDGTYATTTSGASGAPPVPGAINIGQWSTSGGAIQSLSVGNAPGSMIDQLRVDRAITEYTMTLRFFGDLVVQTGLDYAVLPYDALLESWDFQYMGTAPSGAGADTYDILAKTMINLSYRWYSIFTSQATWDRRPKSSYGSAFNLVGHELISFSRGTPFRLDCAALAATPGQTVIFNLHFRRRNSAAY